MPILNFIELFIPRYYFYSNSLFTYDDIDRVTLLPNSKSFAYPRLQRSLILCLSVNTIYAIYRRIINLRVSTLLSKAWTIYAYIVNSVLSAIFRDWLDDVGIICHRSIIKRKKKNK